MKKQRIGAVIGLVLMALSVVMMLAGMFAGNAKALLLNVSLVCFLLAVTVLFILNYQRRQPEEKAEEDQGE